METKSEIRKAMKQQRGLLSPEECRDKSLRICDRLIKLDIDRGYDDILLYSAIRNEVDTDDYFYYLKSKGKTIYYPKVEGDIMNFYRVEALSELSSGSFGISEPDATNEFAVSGKKALMIVPGLAFSDKGYRVGYGKGFYDRYLSPDMAKSIKTIGICYDFQFITGASFEDSYDIALDGVVTDIREVFDYD